MALEISIDKFDGPLDLLLHLIKKNEMDIYDIEIAQITKQYLGVIDAMKSLNLDVAGEFLVMAATLLHVKSRLLLPPREDEEDLDAEEEDPRAELVRRLLEYKKYKEAACSLEQRTQLGRDVYARKFPSPELQETEGEEFEIVGLFELMEALKEILKENPAEVFHEVDVERLSVTDRLNAILSELAGKKSIAFGEIFSERPDRHEVVVTFLAMLELVKLRMVRLMQNRRYGTIWIFPSADQESAAVDVGEESLGYK